MEETLGRQQESLEIWVTVLTLSLKYKTKDEPVEIDNTHEFIVGDEANSYIHDFASGKIPMGLSTGYKDLDRHYRFKDQAFDIVGGTAGLGKTTIACFLFALANALHGKRVIIYSTENPAWELKVFILEFLLWRES